MAIKPDLKPYWDPFTEFDNTKVYEENNGWTIANPPHSEWTIDCDVIVLPVKKFL